MTKEKNRENIIIKHVNQVPENLKEDTFRSCDICEKHDKDAVIVIQGNSICHYCGNEIHLCKEHFELLEQQILEKEQILSFKQNQDSTKDLSIVRTIVKHFHDNCYWQQWALIGIGMVVLAPLSIGGSIGILVGGLICMFILDPFLD